MGGGSVNPLTGAFNFAVTEGYIVRNGEICEPVRGASLIGTGSKILQDIDMVGQNLATDKRLADVGGNASAAGAAHSLSRGKILSYHIYILKYLRARSYK